MAIEGVLALGSFYMNNLNAKILELSKRGNEEDMLEAEKLLEHALQDDPQNTDLLLKLAVLVQEFPYVDLSIPRLEKILSYDPDNALALLILAETNHHLYSEISKPLFDKLTSVTTGNAEIDSMLRYAASWFYDSWFYDNNPNDYELEKLLLESINICQSHVNNYEALAELYMRQARYSEAKIMMQKAIKNVTKIYTKEIFAAETRDMTDVQKFLALYVKGTYVTDTSSLKRLAAEANIREKLDDNPNNIELLLQLALVEKTNSWNQSDESIISIKKILSYDPDNPVALIIWAYRACCVDEKLFKILISTEMNDAEINSMLLRVASWFYIDKDDKKREKLLLQSINKYQQHVKPYYELATLYSKQGKNEEARKLWKKALDNIKVYSNSDSINYIIEAPSQDGPEYIVDVNEFLNTAIKGTHTLTSVVEDLKKKAG